jgi:hypothetical protein
MKQASLYSSTNHGGGVMCPFSYQSEGNAPVLQTDHEGVLGDGNFQLKFYWLWWLVCYGQLTFLQGENSSAQR